MPAPPTLDYAAIFNATSNSLAFTELETGRILDVNEAWIRATGVARDEARGRTALELGLWVSTDERAACLAELAREGRIADLGVRLALRGEVRAHRVSARVVTAAAAPQVLWEFRDVSGHEQREDALRASEARLRLAITAGRMGVWDYDIVADTVYWSDEVFRMFALTPTAVTLRDFLRLVHPDDVDRVEAEYQAATAGRRSFYAEFRMLPPDGVVRWVADYALFRYDDAGNPVRMIGIVQDISEQKRTLERLLDAESRFRDLVEQSPRAVQVVAPDGTTLRVNAAWEKLWGVPMQALARYNLRHDRQLAENGVLQAFERACAGERPVQMTIEYDRAATPEVRSDGGTLLVETTLFPTRDNVGVVREIVLLQEDVTAARRAEAELEAYRHRLEALVRERTAELEDAKAAAEAASRAKSAFLANISHEIRTPLAAITGMAHLIRRGGLTAQQADQLAKLETAGAHLLEILNAVLELSKIEAGRAMLDDQDVDVEQVVGNVLAMLQERAHAKGLSLARDVDAGIPRRLRGDATRLQQALLNYGANAVKFTDNGGVALRVRCDAEDDAGVTLRFEVVDTGIGIAPAVLPRLFGAFEQADNTTTRRYGGTGLGLAVTRKLVEMMGGEVGAESSPDVGSRFWFTARLRHADAVAPAPAVVDDEAELLLAREHAGRRVLLVEDELVNREIAQALLETVGLAVDVAGDGLAAVDAAAAVPYALILMDIQMPNLSGLDAAQRIRGLPHGHRVPIVAMTANAFAEDRERCLAAGMNDFLAKPFTPRALYAMLVKWLCRPAP